jgi:hypothetical protein
LVRATTIEPTSGWNSTVHLVRRECQDLLANLRRTVPEDKFPGRRKLHRLFASAIVICTAFDLLGKLRYGDERGAKVQFTRVLVKYGGLSRVDARRIWDARNALVHSFGVRRVLQPRKNRGPRVSSVRIQLTDSTQPSPVLRVEPRRWQISVPALYRLLTTIIRAVEDDFRQLMNARDVKLFDRMFMRYGRIRIR